MSAERQSEAINIAGGVVALLVIGLLWFITISLVKEKIPPENASNLGQVIGMVSMQVGIIIGWFFGSSSSSKVKDDAISKLSSTAAKAQDALAPLPGAGNTVSLGQNEAVTVKAEGAQE